jgi:ABC-2 type transport system ATP-binding protein
MTRDLAIEAIGLEKSYQAVTVLTGVDIRVPRGTISALLGPNGAGKTTIVRILSTLTSFDKGQAKVAGFDVVRQKRQVRRNISLTGQYVAIDQFQTGQENLRLLGRLAGLSRADAHRRADELLERFGLTDAAGRRLATYSGGMRRRLDLAASLVGQPAVVFLDEPTTGLDLNSRTELWNVIAELAQVGVTVYLTTQYLEEADRLADRVAVLHLGAIVAEGTPAELKQQFAGQRLDIEFVDAAAYESAASALGPKLVRRDPRERSLSVATDGTAGHVRSTLDEIDPGRGFVARFSVHQATLDDVFIALTNHSAQMPVPEREPADV